VEDMMLQSLIPFVRIVLQEKFGELEAGEGEFRAELHASVIQLYSSC
jgi:hypothetical protein